MTSPPLSSKDWEARYTESPCLFGTEPSPLLVRHRHLLKPAMKALALGDGEGRNGIWLAERGLHVLALERAPTAIERARERARSSGLECRYLNRCLDMLAWDWPRRAFDVVTLIFVHLPPGERNRLHRLMRGALRPEGLLFIEAYHKDQLDCASGGPADPRLLYDLEALQSDFADLEILTLERTTTEVVVDGASRGSGIVVHFAARNPDSEE